jgi:hypothetical protein
MDDAAWLSLAIVLTVLAAGWTWFAARRRGPASAVRGAAITLLPAAAHLTGTLELAMRVGEAVGDWAAGLVLRPTVWVGLALGGLAVLLFLLSGFLRTRGTAPDQQPERRATEANRAKGAPAIDDDLGDIEAILKKHGIS